MARIEDSSACEAPKGDPLEGEFIQSSDQVQQFYSSQSNSPLQGIVLLLSPRFAELDMI